MSETLILLLTQAWLLSMLVLGTVLYYQLTYGYLVHRDEQQHRKRQEEIQWHLTVTCMLGGTEAYYQRPRTWRLPRHHAYNAFRISKQTFKPTSLYALQNQPKQV